MGAVAYDAADGFFDDQVVWGTVLDEGRGALPYSLIHGESLVACAAWALGEAGVTAVDVGTAWEVVVDAGTPVVLHDSLCPMTPPEFIAACVRRAAAAEVVVVGVRPVTDTVKRVRPGPEGDTVGETVDRDRLAALASPVVLPPSVARDLPDWPGDDLQALVDLLRGDGHEVELVEAPPQARRVAGPDDVRLVEALTAER
jgi:2-C-methyl-D-erythritol 4-phosphate cytidylyltransferase